MMDNTVNINKICDWFVRNSFTLQYTAGVATHFPFNDNDPSIIDLCSTSWRITRLLSYWHVGESHRSNHSTTIFSITIIPPPAKSVWAWHRVDWETFQQIIKKEQLDFSQLTSIIEVDRLKENFQCTLKKALDKAISMVVTGKGRLRA